jgi:uncharacterized protein YegP (UPF0339 family)
MYFFEIKVSKNPFARQPHYFVLKNAKNGKVVMTSEMYARRGDMFDTMDSIREGFANGVNTRA